MSEPGGALAHLGTAWWVHLGGDEIVLADACEGVGVSRNALTPIDGFGGAGGVQLVCPSYFCGPADFVLVLAHLTRRNLDFHLRVVRGEGPDASVCAVHPPLDPHTRAVLAELAPGRVAEPGELEDRAREVFARFLGA